MHEEVEAGLATFDVLKASSWLVSAGLITLRVCWMVMG